MSDRRRVLFVCTGNTCRSPLAERLARRHYPQHHWESAGVVPTGWMHPLSAAVLRERGADAEGFAGRSVFELELTDYDIVVLIGDTAQSAVDVPPAVHRLDWDVPDPFEASGSSQMLMQVYRECADLLEQLLSTLPLGDQPPDAGGTT